MARRECDREQTIEMLSERVTAAILEMELGGEASIAELAGEWYRSRGYEFRHIGLEHGYVWTRDGGATYAFEDIDLFDVLERVTKKLKGRRVLDFSRYRNLAVGLPYNLQFTVKEAKRRR